MEALVRTGLARPYRQLRPRNQPREPSMALSILLV